MTRIEKELIAVVSELHLAVHDLYYQLCKESREAGMGVEEVLRRREAFLTQCGNALTSVQQKLSNLHHDNS